MVGILVAYLVKTGRRELLPRIWAGRRDRRRGRARRSALALTFGPRGLTFEAQEAIGGGLSIVAVAFVTWMVFWMARAARGLTGELRGQVDVAAEAGWWGWSWSPCSRSAARAWRPPCSCGRRRRRSPATTRAPPAPLVGAALGIATAVVLGYLFYRGAISINLSRVLHLDRRLPDPGRRRRARVRRPRPAGGRHPARPEQPRLRRLRRHRPDTWYATLLKGIFNFSPADHLARGRRPGCSTSCPS